jgi:hypothetical protein
MASAQSRTCSTSSKAKRLLVLAMPFAPLSGARLGLRRGLCGETTKRFIASRFLLQRFGRNADVSRQLLLEICLASTFAAGIRPVTAPLAPGSSNSRSIFASTSSSLAEVEIID